MEQLSILATRKRTGVTRLTRNSKIFKTIIHAIQEKKGENIVSLDLRKIPEAVSDFFVICEAGSGTQVKAIADSIQAEVEKSCNELPYKHIHSIELSRFTRVWPVRVGRPPYL